LAAVVLLDRRSSEAGDIDVRRLAEVAALEELLPHGFRFSLTNPERKRRMMEFYLRLVSTVPIFRARFPSGLERLPSVVEKIEGVLQGELAPRAA
jgi:hypothetical protein